MFKVGDKVRMINSRPAWGAGQVKVGDVGIITSIFDTRIKVDFPAQENWSASERDLELVAGVPDKNLPKVSVDKAVKEYAKLDAKIKELQVKAQGYLQVMQNHNIKPL